MMDEDILNTSCFVLLFSDEGQLPLLVREGGLLSSSEEVSEINFVDTITQVRSTEVLGMELVIPSSVSQAGVDD